MSVSGGPTDESDDSSLSVTDFVSARGTDSFDSIPSVSINLFELFMAIVGAVIFAFFDAVIRLIQLPFQFLTALHRGLANFLTTGVQLVFGVPQGIIDASFLAARADIIGSGLAAFVIAVLVAGITLYILNVGVDFLVR